MANHIKLALDWTPNTNHAPFLVALANGYYEDVNLTVTITDPSEDDYKSTPASRLAAKQVDLALAPSETVFAYRFGTKKQTPIRAVAAVLSLDASAIAVLKDNNAVQSPRDLDGKVYGTYSARFEDAIVREMIRADGGKGDFSAVAPPKLGIWDTLLTKQADATWIFESWEGIEAKQKGVELRCFKMKDYGIPYGYSPLLLENEDHQLRREVLENFLSATQKGARFIAAEPGEAAELIKEYVPTKDKQLVKDSLDYLMVRGAFGYLERWGVMQDSRWESWVEWLREKQLLTSKDGAEIGDFHPSQLYTNQYFDV